MTISKTRRVPFSLETFVKRSWPLLLGGVILVLALGAGLFILAVSGKARARNNVAPESPPAPTNTTTNRLVPRLLDGVAVNPAEAALQPFTVIVENAPEARPLSGVSKANLVMEVPVEGSYTRFMLVFDATSTADAIGPVRSARPYYVEWADALNAVFAHVGGSPESLIKIARLRLFRNLDQFHAGGYFWRSGKRAAPHNVYTRMDLLRAAAGAKTWKAGIFKSWQYLDGTASSTAAVATAATSSLAIPYGGVFDASWKYATNTQSYMRYQAGSLQRDADGTAVSSSNVVVLLTEATVQDEIGRLRLRTAGSGKAWLYRDGQRFDIIWRRRAGEWLTFENVEGGDVFFRPGKTWISVITASSMAPAARAIQ